MNITKVQYTVRAEYAAQNKANIDRVVSELRALQRTDLQYSVFVQDDGKTFIHLPRFASKEAEEVFSSLESFKTFVSELQASQPEVPPQAVHLSIVASTNDMLS
ncbi:hypothetical protein EPA93_05025 [Ktedonosporobacter rubrisoli]|uniref:ABM domain-containing protein n=1 Tax=Ktedonosporobacter rubrisoli TaxID=2509675 RepID=A0A4P6JJU4_KTERU|nr:hypothetical protein [Ktedonosporobacter rubrisoli]QBD75398.1 hypothetical protein EPA93_05025 [Ktedonosporobacter rubrisoli]